VHESLSPRGALADDERLVLRDSVTIHELRRLRSATKLSTVMCRKYKRAVNAQLNAIADMVSDNQPMEDAVTAALDGTLPEQILIEVTHRRDVMVGIYRSLQIMALMQ
jgi:hypothetical protein